MEAIEFLNNDNSIHKTAEKLGVDRKTIKWWKEHKNDYNKITNPSIKKTLHKGKNIKILSLEEEENICLWIDEQNDSGIPINYSDVLNYVLSIENNSLKGRSYLTNIKLISRLLHRKGYTKRCLGHRGQEISNKRL